MTMKVVIGLLALCLASPVLSQRLGVPAPSEDTCSALKAKDACDAAGCSWCTAGAVPSACHTVENAKRLPPSVFVCSKLASADDKAAWDSYRTKYDLAFEHAEEDVNRMDIFVANTRHIADHNAQKSTYTMAMNEFGHLTHTEFRDMMTGFKQPKPVWFRAGAKAAPSGKYSGSTSVLGMTVTASMTIDDASHMDFTVGGPITLTCKKESYKYDGKSTITLPSAGTAGDCIHDALQKYSGSIESVAYDSGADTVTVKVKALVSVTLVLKKSSLEAALAPAAKAAPTGKYSGSTTVLGKSVTATVAIDDATHLDLTVSGAGSCKKESYKYDGTSKITLPDASKKGDCVHDAMAKLPGGASIESIVYDGSADSITVKVKGLLTVTIVLHKQKARKTPFVGPVRKLAGLADSVDWVSAGAVTGVKNQGTCGSCWSFSTTGSIEGAYFLKYGDLKSFSEQQLVDCDDTASACKGGLMDDAFRWVKQNGGLCTESDYPYTSGGGSPGTCSQECSVLAESAPTGYHDVDATESALLAAVAQQPVSTAIEADQSAFHFYSGGVVTGTCGTNLDHGVLIVGYGTDETLGDYWKIKNSWGPSWGEAGYVRVERGKDQEGGECGVLMSSSYPNL